MDDIGYRELLRPEMIVEAVEVVQDIRDKLRIAQDRYKHWADAKRRPLEFRLGDHVLLKISPNREVIRFGKRGKLSPRYIGPFDVLERVGEVAYRLALPPSLEGVHDVFHVSQLRHYISDPSHDVDYSEITVRPDLTYEQQPLEILDLQEQNC